MSIDETTLDLQAFVNRELSGHPAVRLLEAGCGSVGRLDFGGQARMVGIDISEKQLARNTILHEKTVGDIQYHEFPSESFDVIICWDVLEHLAHPELAVRQFAHAIKRGGIVILKIPNVISFKGLVTKALPHGLHVLAYRYFYNDPEAGKNDNAPFRSHLRFCISGPALRKQGVQLGLDTVYFATADVSGTSWMQRKKAALMLYLALKKIFSLLSLGRIGDSELFIVLKKPV